MKKKKHKTLYIVTLLFSFLASRNVTANTISINEVLPNPVGKDNGKEWIELKNNFQKSKKLENWRIKINNKYYTIPTSTIQPNGLKLLTTQNSKIKIPNNNVNITILDNNNKSIDQLFYTKAPEGKSLTNEPQQWNSPTPNRQNPKSIVLSGTLLESNKTNAIVIKKLDHNSVEVSATKEQIEFLELITNKKQSIIISAKEDNGNFKLEKITFKPTQTSVKTLSNNTISRNTTTIAILLIFSLHYFFKARPS